MNYASGAAAQMLGVMTDVLYNTHKHEVELLFGPALANVTNE